MVALSVVDSKYVDTRQLVS